MLGEDDRTPVDVGNEAAFQYWADHGYIFRRVQETQKDKFIVSTVFWGHANLGPDKLFETMIYEDEPGTVLANRKPELAIWHCATWDEAERQHEQACDWLRQQIASGTLAIDG